MVTATEISDEDKPHGWAFSNIAAITDEHLREGETSSLNTDEERTRKDQYLSFNSEVSLLDAALATSAAPTYFPMHTINNKRFVDGGLVANNPSMHA